MNKKQAFIIATLLVLIVCAGILATKVNSPLYVDSTEISETGAKVAKGDFYTEQRLNREQNNAKTLPTYRAIIDDPNAAKEAKESMMQKLNALTTNTQNEEKIEAQLKGKGFEESFCQIAEDKVTVYVRAKEILTDKQAKEIKNIVVGVAKIKDVEIARKQ
jgi:stage III sporulation protein AH